jgi:iron complex transport system substrate-binding protein
MAGGVNIAHNIKGDAANGYVTISLEALIAANPQVIIAGIGMGTGGDAPLQFIKTEDRLKGSDARVKDKIYGVNMDVVSRPGPRIVDALEEFFKLIHPEFK